MKKILIQITPPFIYKTIKRLFANKASRSSKKTIKIDNIEISIPPEFPLEKYQEKFKLYDRFLPILVKHINQNGIIVDIGANIGDTLFSIFHNCKNKIICVEPSYMYYNFLTQNYKLLNEVERTRVELINKFIGTGVFSGELVHEHGTAHIVLNDVKQKNIKFK